MTKHPNTAHRTRYYLRGALGAAERHYRLALESIVAAYVTDEPLTDEQREATTRLTEVRARLDQLGRTIRAVDAAQVQRGELVRLGVEAAVVIEGADEVRVLFAGEQEHDEEPLVTAGLPVAA